jgi:hypothetical protein
MVFIKNFTTLNWILLWGVITVVAANSGTDFEGKLEYESTANEKAYMVE